MYKFSALGLEVLVRNACLFGWKTVVVEVIGVDCLRLFFILFCNSSSVCFTLLIWPRLFLSRFKQP